MRQHELEQRIHDVAARVKTGDPIEDSVYELKTNWIKSENAAERIAGHANASHGEPFIWIFGLDEKNRQVVGVKHDEFSNWHAQVKSHFELNFSPEIALHTNVNVEGKTVVAILFKSEGAPFIIESRPSGTPIKKIPWREGTAIRPAARVDLLSILSPNQRLPQFEFRTIELTATVETTVVRWRLDMELYNLTRPATPITIPFHNIVRSFWIHGENFNSGKHEIAFSGVSEGIKNTGTELTLIAPGTFVSNADYCVSKIVNLIDFNKSAFVEVTFRPLDAASNLTLCQELKHDVQDKYLAYHTWHYRA